MTLQCTPVIINYVSVSQLLYQTHPHTLFGMSLQLVFAVIRHFHITHDASCLISPAPPPPPRKKKRKKKRKPFASRITFNFTWVLTTFTKTIMHLVYFLKFALPLPSISLWTKVIPGEIVNNRHILCIYFNFFFFFFWGGGDINRVHYGLCANGEL